MFKPSVSNLATVICNRKLELTISVLKWNFCNFKKLFLKTYALPKILIPDGALLTRGICYLQSWELGWAAGVESDTRGQSGCGTRRKGWLDRRDLKGWRIQSGLQWYENQGVIESQTEMVTYICQTCLENECLQLCGGMKFLHWGRESKLSCR